MTPTLDGDVRAYLDALFSEAHTRELRALATPVNPLATPVSWINPQPYEDISHDCA